MLFSSVNFLFYFLPVTVGVYFLVPYRWKNGVLLAASLLFYFYGEPVYTFLLLASSLSAYVHGLLIDRFRGGRLSRIFLVSSIVVGAGLLGFFKYADFTVTNLNSLLGAQIPLLRLALPIGISFYTFQTLSYTIDVYRGDAAVQKNVVKLCTYVALFPQLIAGPIVRYTDVAHDLSHRTHSLDAAAQGMTRFVVGLSKKVLLANSLGTLCVLFRQSTDKSVLFYWLYALAFMLQIYFDFSGYSDMAIGLGRVFGFRFPENFRYPFIAKSATEFWRRWHISLGSWFRDYVYIPLGGNRKGAGRQLLNILIVWLLTGLWHGADWTFVAWGLFFAVLLILEKLFLGKLLLRLPGVFGHLYLLLAVAVSFVIFNADGLRQAASDLGGMFGAGGLPLATAQTWYYLRSYAVVLALAILGATPLPKRVYERLCALPRISGVVNAAVPVGVVVLLLVVTAYLVDGGFNPFLYFRF